MHFEDPEGGSGDGEDEVPLSSVERDNVLDGPEVEVGAGPVPVVNSVDGAGVTVVNVQDEELEVGSPDTFDQRGPVDSFEPDDGDSVTGEAVDDSFVGDTTGGPVLSLEAGWVEGSNVVDLNDGVDGVVDGSPGARVIHLADGINGPGVQVGVKRPEVVVDSEQLLGDGASLVADVGHVGDEAMCGVEPGGAHADTVAEVAVDDTLVDGGSGGGVAAHGNSDFADVVDGVEVEVVPALNACGGGGAFLATIDGAEVVVLDDPEGGAGGSEELIEGSGSEFSLGPHGPEIQSAVGPQPVVNSVNGFGLTSVLVEQEDGSGDGVVDGGAVSEELSDGESVTGETIDDSLVGQRTGGGVASTSVH